MTWTYSPALAADKDRVRFLTGDTNAADQQLQDEEITWLVSQRSDVLLAAADACEGIAARYTRQADTTNSKLSVAASKRAAAYAALAKMLQQRALTLSGAQMFAGGLTISGKQVLDENTDAVQPAFSIGKDDEPGANNSSMDPTLWPWS